MASDATKQTISQSLNDLKAEVADRTKSIITGVKIPELESTLLISPTDQVIVETNSGTKRASLKTIGNVLGGTGGNVNLQEVIDARNDGVTNYPQLKNRLDAMDGKTQANVQQIEDNKQNIQDNTQQITTNKQEIGDLTNKYDLLNQEVVDAREQADGTKFTTLGDRLNNTDRVINNLNLKIDDIALIMPPPSTVDENTKTFQEYLDLAKKDNAPNVTIKFRKGEYELNTCTIYSNTHIQLTDKTSIRHVQTQALNPDTGLMVDVEGLFYNSKPFDVEDSKITGYGGRSNIKFEGGTIYGVCPFVLNHGQNIEISNVTFRDTRSDHVLQIASCKNVTIKNCDFYGMRRPAVDRNYVEMIQIDWMTSKSQPYWSTNSAIFDSTVNDGIYIDSCKFHKGQGNYNYMKTCIGSHSSDGTNKNKNIVIKNCEFDNYEYAGVTVDRMDGVVLDNNKFYTISQTDSLQITKSENVDILSTNIINGGRRGIYCASESKNVRICGLTIKNIDANSDYITLRESEDIDVDGVVFVDCTNADNCVIIRNCKDTYVRNCKDVNSEATNGSFVHIYKNNNNTTERITVLNNATNKKQTSFVQGSVDGLICELDEVLWSGSATNGTLNLSDEITKFKDLRVCARMNGSIVKPLEFINDYVMLREINIPDVLMDVPPSGKMVHFMEIYLRLVNNREVEISHINMLNLTDGVHEIADASNLSVTKIIGKRIQF